MNECYGIHETVIHDIIDLIDYFKDVDPDDVLDRTKRNPLSSTSIAKITSNLTLVFPVMCTRTLSLETASMIAKAIERKAVTMLQILFSAFQLTNVENASDFIAMFHKNIHIGDKMTVDDILHITDTLSESFDIKVDPKKIALIKEDMKNIEFYFEENVSRTSLNDYHITRDLSNNSLKVVREGAGRNRRNNNDDQAMNNPYRSNKDYNDTAAKQLLNSDFKKANELVPSTMIVNLISKNADGKPVPIDNIIIGVKAHLVPVDSDDIVNHILTKVQDRNWFFNFIRATTREISFFKDFLFAIDRAKIDALSRSRRGSSHPMWKVLERRTIKSRLQRLAGKSNNASAITTLVVSKLDQDTVLKEHNLDIESKEVVSSVMEGYNLMGFVIADESLELAKFMFDTGENIWENISFNNLERENTDNNYKKIVNLMTKVAR